MTNAYRMFSTPAAAARIARAAGVTKLGLPLIATLAAVSGLVWFCCAVQSQSGRNAQTIALERTAITVGMSRSDCYHWLRVHHLVATNPAYSVWCKNRLGVWFRSNEGAWPEPAAAGTSPSTRARDAANPDVEVKLSDGRRGGCGMAVIEQITFDEFDRVESVSASVPYWTCG